MEGSSLRALRKRLHVNQRNLAARLGLADRTVGNIETGRVSIDRETYDQWADAIQEIAKETGDVEDRVPAAL